MSLQVLQLDDLTWTAMVEAIRTRIIADSNGQWTMHGPLDPGVTLLELFAYQFEQRLYWLDQVSEPMVRGMLALLDDAPQTTTSAKTPMAFRSLEDNLPQNVPAGQVFYPRDRDLPIPFTTLEPATVLPLLNTRGAHPKIELIVGGEDRTADLRAGRLTPLFPADASAAEFQLILWLARPIAPEETDGSLGLFFDLQTASSIAPEWAPLPDDIQWFERVAPEGYVRPLVDDEDRIPGACNLPKALVASGIAHHGGRRSPSTEPAGWLDEFISSSWNCRHLLAEAPATLQWRYSTGPSSRKTFGRGQLTDATGGLRRSGLARIRIPADWSPIKILPDGSAAYVIWVTCEACTYSAPPRLRRVVPNVAIAQQLAAVDGDWAQIKPQVDRWLRLPRQELKLAVDKPPPLEKSVRLRFREADGWRDWRPTDHFYHHGPEDRVFVVDRERKRLLFGNGLTGRIPVFDAATEPYVELCYLAGGGSQGNVGELVWTSEESNLQPRNLAPGIGGADAQTLAEAKARIGSDLSRRERAITAVDFEWLALNTPGIGIARAHAAVGFHPDFPCHPVAGAITVFVAPHAPREDELFASGEVVLAPKTDPGALAEVARRLEARRLATCEVYVRSARYRSVRLAIELQGVVASEKRLRAEITRCLTRFLDPLIGGDQGEGWPFGEPLRPSSLIKQIQTLVDDGIIVKRAAIALDADSAYEDCGDVRIGPHELVYLKEISLGIDATPATQGGLR